ncbi:MAG: precorrin-3B C(17)-methyltransferase [Peptococcaceae bacterium]|nr:precorrin-3B C(17)-methyltransferase [Peptococcaceae bacterium]
MRTGGDVGVPAGKAAGPQEKVCRDNPGAGRGKLRVVGIGPGSADLISPRALKALQEAPVVAGYRTYVRLLGDLVRDKEVISTGMTREADRCAAAIGRALAGQDVAVVSSGDPGVYGMAGLILEMLDRDGLTGKIDVEIIPGITSATATAAKLGAPLMHDFAVISLSDLLTPWAVIEKRLQNAAAGDFVLVLYNPASHRRVDQIARAREILMDHRAGSTPVGLVRNADREDEEIIITDLDHMLDFKIDMLSTVIVGSNSTRKLGGYMVTPRGYSL